MKCQACHSERVAYLSANHSDRFSFKCEADNVDIECDYAPHIDGLCGGDDTRFYICLHCGQVQGVFPTEIS